jgi:hypothetical protein
MVTSAHAVITGDRNMRQLPCLEFPGGNELCQDRFTVWMTAGASNGQ